MPKQARSHEVRIIGGKWKGRKLRFKSHPDLRPTLGRTRETLFNWLRPYISGARCLDLFAGSGILGIEALSQGADCVTFVDRSRQAISGISQTLSEINAASDAFTLVCKDARQLLDQQQSKFDIVFIDPPFKEPDLLTSILTQIPNHLTDDAYCYIEVPSRFDLDTLLADTALQRIKHTRAGDTQSFLCISEP